MPWWYWPLPLTGAGLLAAEAHMGYPGIRSWLPYAILIPLTVYGMIRLGSVVVELRGDTLHVGKAHIAVRHLGQIDQLDPTTKRPALGRELDPAAFVAHRGWVPNAARIEVTDPADPTPYWVVSVRKPARLAELIEQAKQS